MADYQVITDQETADRVGEHVHGAVLDLLTRRSRPGPDDDLHHSAVPALNQLIGAVDSVCSRPV
ncbi:hypothetical protein HBB16_21875 [Pseudonocardia sp. MCCB 268]|nr:hypothetical protein [Pseudonocardia cytotoxica]